MPSKSAKQHKFMEAIAHSPSFAKKAGVPQSVGKDFATADKGKKFSKGGLMAKSQGTKSSAMGKVKTAAPSRDGIASKGKTKGAHPKMGSGPGANGKPGMKSGGMAKKYC